MDRQLRHRVMALAWTLTSSRPESALVCIDAIVQADVAASELVDAASALEEYVARVPNQIDALLRLVEICVDGGLEATMFEAQAQLADAYLSAGHAAEARFIAEDLVAREPWDMTHMDRFRKSLVMLNVADPDAVIAERLNGQAPFMATDPFTDNLLDAEPFEKPAPPVGRETEPAAEPAPVAAEEPAAAGGSEVPLITELLAPHTQLREPPAPKPAPAKPPAPKPAAAKPPAAKPPGAGGLVQIDLESALAELAAEFAPAIQPAPPREDLEHVFQDFRDEVTRQTGADDAAQHMRLAATYLEMGMEDDAIASLRQAARSPRHRFEAGVQLARLFKGRNDLPQAVEWMERAAEAPAASADAGLALLYDLAATLEGMGETARALAVFMELQADAGEYRDVAARVDRLSRVQTGG
jgi:tetratricopeptide (TPR) repeat protein